MGEPCSPTWQAFTPLNCTGLATKSEQREVTLNGVTAAEANRLFQANACLEPSTLDRTGLSSALRSTVDDPHLLASTNLAAADPPGGGLWKTRCCGWCKSKPERKPVHRLAEALPASFSRQNSAGRAKLSAD